MARNCSIILSQLVVALLLLAVTVSAEKFEIAQIRYSGGGDWYGDQTAVSNWLKLLRQRLGMETAEERVVLRLTDRNLFSYPFLYIVGHGNISFSSKESQALRQYLTRGGFLFVNDDYGLDQSFRREIKKCFLSRSCNRYPTIIRSTTVFTIYAGCPKYTSTMVIQPRDMAYSIRSGWWFFMPIALILGMVWRTVRFIPKILRTFES